jgi:hypothetical protein
MSRDIWWRNHAVWEDAPANVTPKGWSDLLLARAAWMAHNPAKAGAWVVGECLVDLLHMLADRLWPAAIARTSTRWRVPQRS